MLPRAHALVSSIAEIQYGFVRNYNRPVHAFLYRRDPTFLQEIAEGTVERKIFSFDYNDVGITFLNAQRMNRSHGPFQFLCRMPFLQEETRCVKTWSGTRTALRASTRASMAASTMKASRTSQALQPSSRYERLFSSLLYVLAHDATSYPLPF